MRPALLNSHHGTAGGCGLHCVAPCWQVERLVLRGQVKLELMVGNPVHIELLMCS